MQWLYEMDKTKKITVGD